MTGVLCTPGAAHWRWRFDEEAFSGRLWMFFLGGRGRGRAAPGCVLLRSFRRTAGCKQSFFCVIYYMLRSGGFAAVFKVIAKGGSSILGHPGQTRAMFQASTTRRPSSRIEDGEGAAAPRSTTDSTE